MTHADEFEPFAWQDDAACAQTDPDLFFPGQGESVKDPKKVCATCTVTEQCLAYAVATHQRHGVWGGRGERQIRKLIRAGDAA